MWTISIGSSSVTMCWCRVLLMWSIIAASVVVFPEPVAPVTRMRPRCSFERRLTPSGRPRLSSVGTSSGHVAEGERDHALLAKAVHAEAPDPGRREGRVEVAGLQKCS